MHGPRTALADDLLQVLDDAFGVVEHMLQLFGFVLENDLHAFVQVTGHFEPFADDRGVELDLGEDRGIGMEVHPGAGSARRAQFLQGTGRLALPEPHLPQRAVALHRGDQFLRQRVDHAGAHAVEAAGRLVISGLELAAGMQHREDHLEGALFRRRMLVDRDAAAVVFDGDRRTVGVERHPDVGGVAVHRLVDAVVQNFPDEVMQAGRADAANVHARPFSDWFQALENRDVFRGVVRRCHVYNVRLVCCCRAGSRRGDGSCRAGVDCSGIESRRVPAWNRIARNVRCSCSCARS